MLYSIINQLDLEHINITNLMFKKISEILNSNENYIKEYIIDKIDDLIDKKKINFYYILLKYILKNSIHIYQIPFLLNTRKTIITAINQLKLYSFDSNDNELKERIEYILKHITDSDYYYNKYKKCWNIIEEKLNILLTYYKNYNFESKKDEIDSIEEIIQKKDGKFENFLNNKEIGIDYASKMNDIFEIIELINELKYKNEEKKEINIQECKKTYIRIQEFII